MQWEGRAAHWRILSTSRAAAPLERFSTVDLHAHVAFPRGRVLYHTTPDFTVLTCAVPCFHCVEYFRRDNSAVLQDEILQDDES